MVTLLDYGASVLNNTTPLRSYAVTWDLEVLPDGRTVFESFTGRLFRSSSVGCDYDELTEVPSPDFEQVDVDPRDPHRIFLTAVDSETLLRSDDGSAWRQEVLPLAGVLAFQVHPSLERKLYYVSSSPALLISTNDGESWTQHPVTLPEGSTSLGTVAAFDPLDPDRAFVGTSENGWWRTLDGGLTWEEKNGGISPGGGSSASKLEARSVALSPAQEGVLYSLVAGEDGEISLWRSINDGDGWSRLSLPEGVRIGETSRVVADPFSPTRFYFWFTEPFRATETTFYACRVEGADVIVEDFVFGYQGISALTPHPLEPGVFFLGRIYNTL